jgi:hypothetical protein
MTETNNAVGKRHFHSAADSSSAPVSDLQRAETEQASVRLLAGFAANNRAKAEL